MAATHSIGCSSCRYQNGSSTTAFTADGHSSYDYQDGSSTTASTADGHSSYDYQDGSSFYLFAGIACQAMSEIGKGAAGCTWALSLFLAVNGLV
jgi:hypothetical protein